MPNVGLIAAAPITEDVDRLLQAVALACWPDQIVALHARHPVVWTLIKDYRRVEVSDESAEDLIRREEILNGRRLTVGQGSPDLCVRGSSRQAPTRSRAADQHRMECWIGHLCACESN